MLLFPVLLSICQVKQRVKELNEQWEIFRTPEGSVGVQQSLKKHLFMPMNASFRSYKLIRIKLTVDGTNLHVVTFGFTIPEDSMGSKQLLGIIHFVS